MASSPVIIQVATPGPAGPTGPSGANGPAGYSPRYYVQPGPPTTGVGVTGDMYINSTNSDVWGPKIDNATWPATPSCNIRGITGATGYSPLYIVAAGAPAPATGNNGDMYINSTTSDLYGPKASGVWGGIVANLKGGTGPAGPPGVAYTPRGAWSAATTYAQGDEATDVSILYISLQSTNLNHVPASSPTWWQPVISGGFSDPTTTKGDIIARGSAPPATRFGIGANGQVLTADSAQTLGIKWATPAPGALQTPWTSDIDAAGFALNNASKIGIGTVPSQLLHLQSPAGVATQINLTQSATASWDIGIPASVNALTFGASGNERVRITATGNVGIGATPTNRLDVWGTTYGLPATSGTATDGTLRIATAGHGESVDIGISGGCAWLQTRSFADYSTKYALLLNPNGGNVGIAVANPSARLHVSGSANFASSSNNILAIAQFSDGGQGSHSAIIFNTGATGITAWRGLMITKSSQDFFIARFDSAGVSGAVQDLAILSNGNIGVGIANPQGILHVDAFQKWSVFGSNVGGVLPPNISGIFLGWNYSGGSGEAVFAFSGGSSGLAVSDTSGGTYKERIRIDSTGKVGFGTASPGGRLEINVNGVGPVLLRLQNDNAFAFDFTRSYTTGALLIQGTQSGFNHIMLCPTSGRVGIGLGIGAAPGYALDVNGEVNATGFRINGTPISTGGFTTQASPARALNTIYQNTTGKTMFVCATFFTSTGGGANAYTDSAASPTVIVASGNNTVSGAFTLSFLVLNGNYYKVAGSGSTFSAWVEWT